MEIQDRNTLMQLALNVGFDIKTSAVESELGFIDMIKIPSVKDNIVPSTDNLIKNNEVSSSKIENKKTVQNKLPQNKKENIAATNKESKTETSTRTDTQPDGNSVNVEDKASPDEKTSASLNENNNSNITQETTDKSTDNAQENVTTIDNTDDINYAALAPVVQFQLINPSLEAETLPNDTDKTKVIADVLSDDVSILPEKGAEIINTQPDISSSKEVKVASATINSQEFVETEVDTDVATTKNTSQFHTLNSNFSSEDELLMQQAQYIDHKLGTSHHVKIDVNVNGEKIAEPLSQNILQNSFEVASILQESESPIFTPPVADQTETEIAVNIPNNNIISTSGKETIPQNLVFFTPADKLAINSASTEDVLSIGAINNNALHSQTFAKTESIMRPQELNNNDSLKGMAKEVVEQIKVNITKSAVKGVDTIDIELKPEDLGKVQIRMYISKDGRLHADIIASRQETSDLLQREVESLSKSFQDAGYDTDSQSFNFSFQKENQTNQQQDNQLQKFIGDTLEQENQTNVVNDNQIYDPKVGLNIRV